MPFISTNALLTALKGKIAAIPLEAYGDEPLIETVELYHNRDIGQAMADLLIFKQRVCLIVPTGWKHENNDQGSGVTSRRMLEVGLLIADRAYTKAGDPAAFGGDKNAGVFAMAEKVIDALLAVDLSGYGSALPGDGDAALVSDAKKQPDTTRVAWVQQLLIPAGASAAVATDAD